MILLKTTGMIRKVDELGRIVLPKELRKVLNIHSGDDFQIIVDENKIILEKFSRILNVQDEIIKIKNIFKNIYGYDIYITNNDSILETQEKIAEDVFKIIQQRKLFICDHQIELKLNEKLIVYGKTVIFPIIVDSDLLGGIIIISNSDVHSMQLVAKTIFELVKKYFI